jgi:hypothetical protein
MSIRVSLLASAVAGALGGAVVTAALLLNSASAADKEPAAPAAILTVYVSEGGSSVKSMNEAHNKYFAQGYRFASMVSHDEDSDHKGVWITYVRQ